MREKEERYTLAIVTMIFFFFFLPLLDSGRLLIGEEKRGIKEIGRRKVYDLFTRVIRLH